MNHIKKYQAIVGLFFVALIGSYFVYQKNNPINQWELIEIKGSLKEKPYFGKASGDMPQPFIEITLNESKSKYTLISCSYHSALTEEILDLNAESMVQLKIKKTDKDKNDIEVFEMRSASTDYLILSEFNDCYTKKWRTVFLFAKSFAAIIILMLLIDLFRYLRILLTKRD